MRFVSRNCFVLFTAVLVGLLGTFAALPLLGQTAVPQQEPAIHPAPSEGNFASLSLEDQGDLLMARKRFEAAINTYLRVEPKTAVLWNKLGIAYQQMNNIELAKKSYKNSLTIDSKSPNVLNNMGTIYYALGEYGSAERYYRKALKLDPKAAVVHKNLGTDLLAEDKFKRGWESYQAALAIDPSIFDRTNNPRIGEPTATHNMGAMNYFLAKSYLSVGMAERAVEYLRKAIDEGFIDRRKLMVDKEFASLHGVDSFVRLISEQTSPSRQ